MPDFDTRTPQEPDEPSKHRIASIAHQLRNLSIASKRRTVHMAGALRDSLMANWLRALLISGLLFLFVVVAIVGLLDYSFSGMGNQLGARLAGDSQERICLPMTTQLAENAEQKIIFVSGSSPGYMSGTHIGPEGSTTFEQLVREDSQTSDFKMYAINADGTSLTRLTKTTASGYGLTNRLPDGREATIDWTADGKNVLSITLQGGCSPDGTKIAYTSDEQVTELEGRAASSPRASAADTTDIYLKTADGTGRITDTAEFSESSPVWSPDSEKIAYWRWTDIHVIAGDIFVMNADGTDETNLTRTPTESEIDPAWSPDGTKIAFKTGGDLNNDFYLINTDGTGLTRLTPKNANIYAPGDAPLFSPDGTKIAFVNWRQTPSGYSEHEVYVANTDGTGLTRLTNGDIVAWVRAKNE